MPQKIDFEILSENQSDDLKDTDSGEEDNRSFAQILKKKNKNKYKNCTNSNNNCTSQASNSTQSDTQKSNTLEINQKPYTQNIHMYKQTKKTPESLSLSQIKWKKSPPINIFNQDPKAWKLAQKKQ